MKTEKRSLGAEIAEIVKQVTGNSGHTLPLHEPEFSGNEWAYVKECLDTGWVSSVGRFVERLENDLAAYTGSGYAVAVVNGTAALHIALLLSGVEPGEEVLIPSLTFVATANAVSYCQAVPHFVDVDRLTLGLDPIRLHDYLHEIGERRADKGLYNRKTGRRIRAVVPMHTFGHPVDMDALLDVCQQYGLEVVEDAAESLGSKYKGRHTGTFGRFGALSFNGNKVVTTGGGGAILTQDKKLAEMAKHLTTTAKLPHPWVYKHDRIGYNYRMPNINAALGCAQLEKLPEFLARKRKLAEKYREGFKAVSGISFFSEPEHAESNYWLNAIILNEPDMQLRDEILQETNKHGFLTRPIWTPLHLLPMYADCPRMELTVTMELEGKVINLPSGPSIIREEL
ncbi:LegC family aminotransferase [Cohnella laeviribosi]|uniref:LegC family aminotransferase n=1 Tax=Cohnella laeviribosi TaxID=380174 RepID=UPI003D257584